MCADQAAADPWHLDVRGILRLGTPRFGQPQMIWLQQYSGNSIKMRENCLKVVRSYSESGLSSLWRHLGWKESVCFPVSLHAVRGPSPRRRESFRAWDWVLDSWNNIHLPLKGSEQGGGLSENTRQMNTIWAVSMTLCLSIPRGFQLPVHLSEAAISYDLGSELPLIPERV